ncbi:polysaccharide biosynthesis protein [Bacillus subtilis]
MYHGGGDKDVGLMEENGEEGVKKNIMGRKNVGEGGDMWGSERFVVI